MEEPSQDSVVIEIGSRYIRVGLAKLKEDELVEPISIPHVLDTFGSACGEDALLSETKRFPCTGSNRRQQNKSDLTAIIQHSLKKAGLEVKTPGIVFVHSQDTPKTVLLDLEDIAFDILESPSVFFLSSTNAHFAAATKPSAGIILDIGDTQSSCLAVYELYCVAKSIRLDLGGRDITEFLASLLLKKDSSLSSTQHFTEKVREIKEQQCFIGTPNFEAAFQLQGGTTVQAELGHQSLSISGERLTAPEILFKPNLIGRDHGGVQSLVAEVVMQAHMTIRKELVKNIFISGGSSLFPGFAQRLEWELKWIDPEIFAECKVKVAPGLESWKGAAVAALLPEEKVAGRIYKENRSRK